jgi:hypothetical protein
MWHVQEKSEIHVYVFGGNMNKTGQMESLDIERGNIKMEV